MLEFLQGMFAFVPIILLVEYGARVVKWCFDGER